MKNYKQLAKSFELLNKHNELKKALTHKSFYNDDKHSGSSRYIFLGMYGFKGKVCSLLFNFLPLDGTNLQHYLGNLFKNEFLNTIYEKYQLENLIRFGENFDVVKHKHIFVYGFLGFICQYATNDKINQFIYHNFLINTKHLIPKPFHNKDFWAQLNYLSKSIYQLKTNIETINNHNNEFETIIKVGTNIISQTTSKSYRYSRIKAIKKALVHLADILATDYEKNPEYQQRQKEREIINQQEIKRLKDEKQKQRKNELEAKISERKQKREKRKKIAQIKNQKRRKANADAKIIVTI